MHPHDFYGKWASHIPRGEREQFLTELAMLLTVEQNRERRRLCTDARLYREACQETAAEIRRERAGATLEATA
jgi:hypothetical protein